MTVHNINGTSDNTCKCGSWLKHWETYSGQSLPSTCAVDTCKAKPEVGAHVKKVTTDAAWYIIPVCKAHNAKQTSLKIRDTVKLAPANVSATCGKPKA